MKSQCRTRKRQIEKDAKIDKKDVAGMRARLDRFLIPFFKHFSRSESKQNAATMVQGLLSDLKRKNTESIAYRSGIGIVNGQRPTVEFFTLRTS